MTSSQGFLSFFLNGDKMFPRITGQDFIYNSKTRRIQLHPERSNFGYFIRFGLLLCIFLACLFQLIYRRITKKKGSNPQTAEENSIQNGETLMLLSFILLIGFCYWEKANQPDKCMNYFINGMLTMETCIPPEFHPSLSVKAKLARLFCRINERCIMPYAPILASITCTLNQGIPLNFLSIVIHIDNDPVLAKYHESSTKCTLSNYFIKDLLIFVINYILWSTFHKVGHCLFLNVLIGPMSLTWCHISNKRMLISIVEENYYSLTNHPSKQNRFCVYTRVVEILADEFNNCSRSGLMALLVTCGTAEIMSVLILVKSSESQLSPPLLCFLVVVVFQTVTIILVIYGFAADLHYESKKVTFLLSTNQKVRSDRFLKRFVKSCRVLRAEFGSSNYIEKTTPLVFQKFCIDRIVDLLLVGNKRL